MVLLQQFKQQAYLNTVSAFSLNMQRLPHDCAVHLVAGTSVRGPSAPVRLSGAVWLLFCSLALLMAAMPSPLLNAFAQPAAVLIQPEQSAGSGATKPRGSALLQTDVFLPAMLGGLALDDELLFSADSIEINSKTQEVTLAGAVEIYSDDLTLLADAVFLNLANGSGEAVGNVVVKVNGNVIAADEFRLDQPTSKFLASNIMLAIDDVVDASARRISTDVNGRTLIDYFSASPCQTCLANGVTPIWHVEARRVELDQDTQQMYMYGATIHFLGVPVLPVPYYQDVIPGTTRQSGLLSAVLESDERVDYQLVLGYFHAFDDSADITLTPSLYFDDVKAIGSTLRSEYRQAFANGTFGVDVNAGHVWSEANAAAFDAGTSGVDGDLRLFGDYGFHPNWRLSWDWTETTNDRFDDTFLGSSARWKNNQIMIEGFSRRNYLSLAARDARVGNENVDPEDHVPDYFPVATAEYVSEPNSFGLTFRSQMDARYLERGGDAREYARIVTDNRVSAPIHLGGGIVANTTFGTRLDGYAVERFDVDNPASITASVDSYSGEVSRVVPYVQAKLDAPVVFVGQNTASIINPIAALTWVSDVASLTTIPNEDNHHAELDAANLFAVNRSGGWDWIERGARLDLGAEYKSISTLDRAVFNADETASLSFDAFAGLGLKMDAIDQYDANSGLDGNLTELILDASLELTDFGRTAVGTRWDLETREMTRGLVEGSLSLPSDYSISTSAERQLWQNTDSWNTGFDISIQGLLPFTKNQFWQSSFSESHTSSGEISQWAKIGVSGQLGAREFLYPWRYDLDYKQRVDGVHDQELKAVFSYNCDCANFFIDTTLSSGQPGNWDADITFRFDLTGLLEERRFDNIERLVGF